MSLADRLKAERPNYQPSFREWLISLTPEDRAALETAAVDPAWTTAKLLALVVDEGGPRSKDSLGEWRRSLGYTR